MAIVPFKNPAAPRENLAVIPDFKIPDHNDKTNLVDCIVSPGLISSIIEARRKTDLFEAWSHLVGRFPPINNGFMLQYEGGYADMKSIRDSHACFAGLQRPCNDSVNGEGTFIYVLSTPSTIRWRRGMDFVASVKPVAEDLLLTFHVNDSSDLQLNGEVVSRVVTKWEFVQACVNNPLLPENYNNRYQKQLWLNNYE